MSKKLSLFVLSLLTLLLLVSAALAEDLYISKGIPFEFDADRGESSALSKIDYTHYLCAYQGPDYDGWAVILTVDPAAGTITKGIPFEFEINTAKYPTLSRIDATHHLCAYEGPDYDGWAVILTVNTAAGRITKGTSFEFDANHGRFPALSKIDATHYLCAYQGPGYNGWAVILTVDTAAGTITKETPFEFYANMVRSPTLSQIDATHYLCAYSGGAVILTVDTAAGTITRGACFYDGVSVSGAISKIDATRYLCAGGTVILTVDTAAGTITKGTPFDDGVSGAISKIDATRYLCAGGTVILTVDTAAGTITKGASLDDGVSGALSKIDDVHYLCAYRDPYHYDGWAVILYVDPIYISTASGPLTEAAANDGSLVSGDIVVTVENGTFADPLVKADVTVNNLPAGMDYTVARDGDTQITVTLTGNATNHANADDVDVTVTVAHGKITGATGDVTGEKTTGDVAIDFNDPTAISTTSGPLTESAANDGSLTSGEILVTAENGTFADPLVKADVTVNNLPAGMDYTVTRDSDTQITVALTGNATNHTNADDVDVTITIAQAKVTGATEDLTTTGSVAIDFCDTTISTSSGPLTESATNDGSLAPGDIVVTVENGTFADPLFKADVTVNNLPPGMDYTVTRDSETQITVALTGNAINHADADNVDVTVTVAQAKVTGAPGDLTTGSVAIDFYDAGILAEDLYISKGIPFEFDADRGEFPALSKIDYTHYLCAYKGPGDDVWAVILTVDTAAGTITKGTPFEFDTNDEWHLAPVLSQIDATHYLCAYRGPGSDGWAVILTVNTAAGRITKGTSFEFDANHGRFPALSKIDATHYLCAYQGPGYNGWAVILTVDTATGTITKETPSEFDANMGRYPALSKIDATHYLCAYSGGAVILTVDTAAGTITKGTPFKFHGGSALSKIDATHYLCAYSGGAVILTVDTAAGTITKGTPFDDGVSGALSKIDATRYLCAGGTVILTVDTVAGTITKGARLDDAVSGALSKIDDVHYLCAYRDPYHYDGWAVILYVDPVYISTASGPLAEAAASDGSLISGDIVVTVENGTFEDPLVKGDVTVNNLPAGMDYTVTRDSDTQITVTLTGNAAKHTNANNVNVTVTVAQARITGAIADKTTGNVKIDFNDPTAISTSSGPLTEAAPNDGSLTSGDIVVTVEYGTFADPLVKADVTVNRLPAGMDYTVTRDSDTQITVTLTGNAANHANANDVYVTITVVQAKITGAEGDLTTGGVKIDFHDVTISTTSGPLTEVVANDGSLVSGDIVVTVGKGTFADPLVKADVTVNNLPAGMDYTVTRDSDTQITVTLTGNATNHTDADDVDVTVTVAQAKVTGATGDVTTGTVAIDFYDPAISIYRWQKPLKEADANDGSLILGDIVVRTNSVFADPLVKADVTVNNLPAGMDYTVARNSDTQITVTLTGNATNHTDADDVDVTITVAQAKVMGATGDLTTTGSVEIDFNDPDRVAGVANGDYIRFGGKDWIMLHNGTGYVILKEGDGTRAFCERYAGYPHGNQSWDVGSCPGNTGHKAPLNTYLNETFYGTIINADDFVDPNGSWFIEAGHSDNSPNAYTWTGKIALLTLAEFYYYGGPQGPTLHGTSNKVITGYSSDDHMSWDWWLLTPSGSSYYGVGYPHTNYVWFVSPNNQGDGYDPRYYLEIRPTLYLKPGLVATSGDGSSQNPWVITTGQPTISITSGSLREADANDGSLVSGDIVVIVEYHGIFADPLVKADVTVNNLPAGMAYTVTRNSDTQITVTLTGNATNHTDADDVDVTITVAQAKVTGATEDLTTTGSVAIDFYDVTISIYRWQQPLKEADANDGSLISGDIVVTAENGTFADPLVKADVTVNNLPAGMGYTIARDSDTQITVALTGNATNHTDADDVDVTITVAQAKVTGATGDLTTTGSVEIDFNDPDRVPGVANGDYIRFGGKDWIMLHNGTGYVILKEGDGTRAFCERYAGYPHGNQSWDVGSCPGNTGHKASLNTYLNKMFYSTITDADDFVDPNGSWFIEAGHSDNSPNAYTWTGKVALLTLTELYYYRGPHGPNLHGISEKAVCGGGHITAQWRLLTPDAGSVHDGSDYHTNIVWHAEGNRQGAGYDAYYPLQVRPTLHLKPGLVAASGDGSSQNPWVITTGQPTISITSGSLREADANDARLISGDIVVTAENGTFADPLVKADVTVNNLPAGMDYTVTRNSDTQITVTLTGNATNHTDADDVDVTITVAQGKITRATGDLTTAGSIQIDFNDPDRVPELPGDFNGDGEVDLSDFSLFVQKYGLSEGNDDFDPLYDLDGDGCIGLGDFSIFVRNYGKRIGSAKAMSVTVGKTREASLSMDVVDRAAHASKSEAASGDMRLVVRLNEVRELKGYSFKVRYDPGRFDFREAKRVGAGFLSDGNSLWPLLVMSPTVGEVIIADIVRGDAVIGDTGVLVELWFQCKGSPENAKFTATEGVFMDVDGEMHALGSAEVASLPQAFALFQNYPNPFNAPTVIRYRLPEASEVRLSVYNLLGQEVRRLVDGEMEAGTHSVLWDGRDEHGKPVGSGIYLYRLKVGEIVRTRKALLLR